jgi:hypothetical protein
MFFFVFSIVLSVFPFTLTADLFDIFNGTPEGFAGPTPIEGMVVLLLNHI